MTKFITGDELEDTIDKIIWEAQKCLMLVSPFIKLDNHFKKIFNKHLKNDKLSIIILFGKNEGNIQKSLNKEDFEFFTQFPNISIIYVPNLHAKYYANEKEGVITSVNLYDYSFVHNIEFGVHQVNSLLDALKGNSADSKAWDTSWSIAKREELVFAKRPVYKKKVFSKVLGKTYETSVIVHDVTEKFYSGYPAKSKNYKTILHFPTTLDSNDVRTVPQRNFSKTQTRGYCIRTGVEIPFNPEKPFSYKAYQSWIRYENPNYQEKYCHLTGKPSYGKTSFNNPIL